MQRHISFRPEGANKLPPPLPRPLASAPLKKKLHWHFEDMNRNPKKRLTVSALFVLLYTAAAIAGFQYLQDTKYKATGAQNPYRPRQASHSGGDADRAPVEPHDTTPVYDGLAKEYDSKIRFEEFTSYIWWMRRRLGRHVKGDALEVACGTGRNIPYLKSKQIRSLTLLDSSQAMLEVARDKVVENLRGLDKVQLVKGRAEDLVELTRTSHQQFDTIFESFGLCSHEDPLLALQNMRQLLRPDGRIVLLEHGHGYYESMNKRMDEKALERAKEWGCRWNLDIDKLVKESELEIEEEGRYHFGTVYFYVLKLPHGVEGQLLRAQET